MYEVEIRGRLSEEQYLELKKYLSRYGKFTEKHNREMLQLFDYPGYDHDPTTRNTDIRLRNTDGFCEIMVKHKASEGNTARKEISLGLKDADLTKAREIAKAFGCKKCRRMIREKEIYVYKGIEWSLVNCPPKNIKYFEAEKTASAEDEITTTKEELISNAKDLGLESLDDSQMKEFIYWLDEQVNTIIDL